jgi:hypothetical protein
VPLLSTFASPAVGVTTTTTAATATTTTFASAPAATTTSLPPAATTTSATTTTAALPSSTTGTTSIASLATPGYWVTTNAGSVASFGGAAYKGSLGTLLHQPIVAIAGAGNGGYWLADADGTVYPIGDAPALGSFPAGALGPGQEVVAMAATPDSGGYWLVTSAGAVYGYGDAGYHGSAADTALQAPIAGIAPTPDGKGYWLVANDGGIFAYGDAHFYGSGASTRLTSRVVGVAPTPDGKGYWIATSAGRVLAFGDAAELGRGATANFSTPVVAIAPSPYGYGYWLLGSDGTVESFGSALYRGGGQGTLPYRQRVVAMAVGPGSGTGVESAGAFGPDSPSKLVAPTTTTTVPTTTVPTTTVPTTTVPTTTVPTTALPRRTTTTSSSSSTTTTAVRRHRVAPTTTTTKPKPPVTTTVPKLVVGPPAYPSGARGYDISWPQCGGPLPPKARVAVVGVNGGWAFTGNPCFVAEARWAGDNLTTYINLNSPRGADSAEWAAGPAGRCTRHNFHCESYNYGYNTARFSVRSSLAERAKSKTWWLDVELGPNWSSSQRDNAAVIAGAISALRALHLRPAVYSTTYQWDIITGGYVPGTAAWYPTGIATPHPGRWCFPTSFAGGPVSLVQSAAGRYDGDYSC